MSNMHLDERDHAILAERVAERDTLKGPRVGDFVVMDDGRLVRISYLWPDTAQVSEGGSWYLGERGYVSFSGSLEPGFRRSELRPINSMRDATFWFFHHKEARADNGVYVAIPCRVYRRVKPTDENGA